VDENDVRLLLQTIIYLDWLIERDKVIRYESWQRQLGEAERQALQRLVDAVGL
jgi:hypothetical protein